MFHIKRFQYKASQYFAHSVRRDKINKYVDYDTNGLDMGPYCLDPKVACEGKEPIYDLIGVVNHMGSMVSTKLYSHRVEINFLVIWSLHSSSAAS